MKNIQWLLVILVIFSVNARPANARDPSLLILAEETLDTMDDLLLEDAQACSPAEDPARDRPPLRGEAGPDPDQDERHGGRPGHRSALSRIHGRRDH